MRHAAYPLQLVWEVVLLPASISHPATSKAKLQALRKKPVRKYLSLEMAVPGVFLLSASIVMAAVAVISLFVFRSGIPLIQKVGLVSFLTGRTWDPSAGIYGILPMLTGSLLVTITALVLGVPVALAGAVFLSEFAPITVAVVLRRCIELLAGIPSVVYGFFGVIVLLPLLRQIFGGSGFSVLAGAIVLAIMILPTVLSVSLEAIKTVPQEYREGSLALGATHWQTIKGVVLPAARSGIFASFILGMGRALGETMAVIMVVGNTTRMPRSLLDPVRTLTANVVIEMKYATGDHQQALFATGIVLFLFIMALNFAARLTFANSRRSK